MLVVVLLAPFSVPLAWSGTPEVAPPEAYDVVAPGDWIEIAPLPSPLPEVPPDPQFPVRLLVVDRQIRDDDASLQYTHVAMQMLNQSGVDQGSHVQVSFDPLKDHLHIHAVTLLRGDERIDEIKSGRIQVLQRETGLEKGVMTGNLTFDLLLNDVRVGDTVEFSYTLERHDPEWGSRHFGELSTRWNMPIDYSRIRLFTPEHARLKVLSHDGTEPVQSIKAGWKLFEWKGTDLPPVVIESDPPPGFEAFPSMELSQFDGWGDVASAAATLFNVPPPTTAEFADLVKRFRGAGAAQGEQALAAIRFVQEEIRYTGLELGQGAYRPRPPEEVLASRYGDCKDKAVLAVMFLRALGVEAAPTLVSTVWRDQLATRLPGPQAFNHAIVRARIGSKVYWFDVTATAQGGDLEHSTQSDLGAGLVIKPGTKALEQIPPALADAPLESTTETFDLRDGLKSEAGLEFTMLYRGAWADLLRLGLRQNNAEKLGRLHLNLFKKRYPGIRSTGDPEIKDDKLANEITVHESYRIDQLFVADGKGRAGFSVNAESVNEYLHPPQTSVRNWPLGLKFPLYSTEHIEVRFPLDWPIKDDNNTLDGPGFHYLSTFAHGTKTVDLNYEYRTLANQVPTTQLVDFLQKLEQARINTYYSFSYDPSKIATIEQSSAVPAALKRAADLMKASKFDEADKALESIRAMPGFSNLPADKQHAVLLASADVALRRGDTIAAQGYLHQSSVMDAANSADWLARMGVAVRLSDYADAAQSLAAIAGRWPEALRTIQDWAVANVVNSLSRSASVRQPLLKALLDAHYLRQDGNSPDAWWCELALMQLKQGLTDEALVSLQAVDSPSSVVGVLADNRYAAARALIKPPLDVAAIQQRRIESIRAALASDPEHLAPVLRLADALLLAVRPDEALQVLDGAISDLRDKPEAHAYKDYDSEYAWILNERSRALEYLGRWDEAVAQLTEASKLPEFKSPNVSQVLNLAELDNFIGRPGEARKVLQGLEGLNLSPFGAMNAALHKLDSAVQLDDKDEIALELKFLKEHRQDDVESYQTALIDANRINEAVDLMKERLANPDERVEMLKSVQHYLPTQMSAIAQLQLDRWLALVARPDIQAAIRKVGSIGTYPLSSGPY